MKFKVRLIISIILGIIAFSITPQGIRLPVGIGVILLFMGLTDKDWRGEAYHKGIGTKIAEERFERNREARIRDAKRRERGFKEGMKAIWNS